MIMKPTIRPVTVWTKNCQATDLRRTFWPIQAAGHHQSRTTLEVDSINGVVISFNSTMHGCFDLCGREGMGHRSTCHKHLPLDVLLAFSPFLWSLRRLKWKVSIQIFKWPQPNIVDGMRSCHPERRIVISAHTNLLHSTSGSQKSKRASTHLVDQSACLLISSPRVAQTWPIPASELTCGVRCLSTNCVQGQAITAEVDAALQSNQLCAYS